MDINFNGYNEQVTTFMTDNTVTEGCMVKMKSSGTVTKCAANDAFLGICLNVRDGYAAVQTEGYLETEASGEIAVGDVALVSAASGVKAAQSGKTYRVIYVGSDTVGFLL